MADDSEHESLVVVFAVTRDRKRGPMTQNVWLVLVLVAFVLGYLVCRVVG